MASTFRASNLLAVILVFLLLSAFCASSSSSSSLRVGDREISGGSSRNLLGFKKNIKMVPNCTEKSTKSECLQGSKCRWCQSDAIDDMCFTTSEAWRLPPQIFSCE